MTPGRITRAKAIDYFIAIALVLILLFTGCVSTPPRPLPRFPPQDKKGNIHTVGVVSFQHPELAMHAYKKNEQVESASQILQGAGAGAGLAYDFFTDVAVTDWRQLDAMLPGLGTVGSGLGLAASGVVLLVAVPLGVVVGSISAAAKAVPASRAEEIVAAVFPALSDFPFQQRMVEHIVAAGTSNTEYNFLDLHSEGTDDHLFEQVDTILEVSVQGVSLYRLEKALQVIVVVQAQLIEKDTGTILVSRSFCYGGRAFGKKRPKSGDESLTKEEIGGYLYALSGGIVDILFLMDDFSARFPNRRNSNFGLMPKYPKPRWKFFGSEFELITVDSLQPRLEWVTFPSQRDIQMDNEGRLDEIEHVSYDLSIWRMVAEEYHPLELVYERKGLGDPWHTVEQPLEQGTTYYWSVRARFVHDGYTAVTRWTTYTDFLPLKDSPFMMIAGLYRFSTPPP